MTALIFRLCAMEKIILEVTQRGTGGLFVKPLEDPESALVIFNCISFKPELSGLAPWNESNVLSAISFQIQYHPVSLARPSQWYGF